VQGKVGQNDYKVDVNGKPKLFHINMLKKYVEREPTLAAAAVIDVGETNPEVNKVIELPDFDNTESVKDIHFAPTLDKEKEEEAKKLCEEFQLRWTTVPGQTDMETCDIELESSVPIHVKGYPVPYATREIISQEVRKMKELGVIEPSKSPYSAPVVIVKKKTGEHRFCIDFRRLNCVTKVDAEVMPNIEDLYAELSRENNKFFTRIDLSKGYWQIPLSDDSKEKTGFTCPDGHFQFRVMPFGLVNAPAVFTRMMRKLLGGVKGAVNFMDDILVASKTWEEHMATLREVLKRLEDANLTARPSKCQIGYASLDFLGFVVGENSKEPEQGKIEQILKIARPRTKTEVRSLLGLVGFYREFVPNFAAITSPLTDMVKKGKPNQVVWTEEADQALDTVKKTLSSHPILRLPDFDKPFILRTDASGTGLGAVLMQEVDGKNFPVRYASRKLNKCEQAYATVEKECLAVVWAVEKFQKYLYGAQFVLETDHQPLRYLQEASLRNSRVLRWAMLLQPYRYVIRYIPGRQNVGADFFSRVEEESEQ
jgi:hypothetical protein